MTLWEQIVAILRRNGIENDTAAEELHAMVIEIYGPEF
ncbi:hypothetical protein Pukovnik_66 [Mycobacterium phage Pukovnik]|uniref:Uncharacterized protein n=1 Tax=Mycobacterium phage Pukovnik TaxID=2914013 RepID=B3VGL5_9CAUD|nr:hypothetical protein Pukovnik_66 [Mycobacterium phage Pukovnik]ACE79992.1 hypothetical protein Pukovnik_66 [Mycobacterium phage Pukovnik]